MLGYMASQRKLRRVAQYRASRIRSGLKGSRTFAKQRFRPRLARATRGFQRVSGFFGRFGKGGELKFHDLDIDDAVIAAGMNVQGIINNIAQGTTEVQRIGRKCTIRSINWRYAIDLPASTTSASTSDVVRVMLVLDKQCNGALPGNTSILESNDFQSFNNLANRSRYRTLMDRTYDIEASSGGGDGTTEDYGESILNDTFFKKVNISLEFDAVLGAITEIRSNNLIVLIGSRSGLAGFGSKMRLRFSDN